VAIPFIGTSRKQRQETYKDRANNQRLSHRALGCVYLNPTALYDLGVKGK
jgi:hypothetical protein